MTIKPQKMAVITLFPQMFSALTDYGVTSRAFDRRLVQLQYINPRDFTSGNYQSVDDRPFGGGPGMVMQFEPLYKAVKYAKSTLGEKTKVIYLSPQGKQVTHQLISTLAVEKTPLIFVCGRYEGIDERFIQHCVDLELSIGDYVVSGGELPAMMIIDAMVRLLPGVLGDSQSAEQDSFYQDLLDCPQYTRPANIQDVGSAPEILLSGNHRKIELWRRKQSLGRTLERRPELIDRQCLSDKDIQLLTEYNNEKISGKQ